MPTPLHTVRVLAVWCFVLMAGFAVVLLTSLRNSRAHAGRFVLFGQEGDWTGREIALVTVGAVAVFVALNGLWSVTHLPDSAIFAAIGVLYLLVWSPAFVHNRLLAGLWRGALSAVSPGVWSILVLVALIMLVVAIEQRLGWQSPVFTASSGTLAMAHTGWVVADRLRRRSAPD